MPHTFVPGVPETRNFPLPTWERLQRQVLKEYGHRALQHSPAQGVLPLRQAIADYVNLERGARATPEQVLVLTSTQQALSLCAQVLLDPGDRILIEDPVYHGPLTPPAWSASPCHWMPRACRCSTSPPPHPPRRCS